MKIGVPIAAYHPGNTGEYVLRALEALGHQAVVLTKDAFCAALQADSFEYYIGVDSGEPLSFLDLKEFRDLFPRIAFWFIDYRHNKDRPTRDPTDFENAKALATGGGWIFQAQYEDYESCLRDGFNRTAWVPVAADPAIWSNTPLEENKRYDLGFAGNIWDEGRAQALRALASSGLRLGFGGHGKVWGTDAAKLLRASRAGFNISSWFGETYAYDINMRFFETLSCGVPLITNQVPSLQRVFEGRLPFVRTYNGHDDLLEVCFEGLSDEEFLESGRLAREWIQSNHTYVHRVDKILQILSSP